MTIALSGDFIPHMVYKWMKSNETNLEGYIEWSVTAFNTSDWGDINTWNKTKEKGLNWTGPGVDIIGKADNGDFYLLDPDTCRGPHCDQDAVIVDGKSYPKMPDKCYFKVSTATCRFPVLISDDLDPY